MGLRRKGYDDGYQYFLLFVQCVFFHHRRIPTINPFSNNPWFLRVCSTILLKTLCEKEKLLVTSNFSFSHSVFCRSGELSGIFIKFEFVVCKLFQFGRVQTLSSGKGLRTYFDDVVPTNAFDIYRICHVLTVEIKFF